jgi:hypothetical protein
VRSFGLLTLRVMITAACVYVGGYAGKLIDDLLSAQIGDLQSTITGYVVLVTLLVCWAGSDNRPWNFRHGTTDVR